MDNSKSTLYISVLSILIFVRFIPGETINDTETLMDDLFTKANYNKDFRGISDQSKALRVGATLSVVTLGEIKETEEAFEVMGLLYLSWYDERLMWNITQYNGTLELVIFQEKVWKPEVKLANPMYGLTSLGDERTQLRLYNTGLVYWMTQDTSEDYSKADLFRASCKLDVVSFPWDRQSCSLNFIVAAYLPKEVIIEAESDTINIKSLEENESWEVVETKAVTLNGVNSQVQFWICVERRPYFQICVVFLPIVFLSMLNPFVFFIKVDSGERISFSITLLLSITLNLSMVATNLPTHSRKMSAMIFSLDYVLLESTFICLMSIFSLHVYHKQGTPSRFWQHVTLTCLRRRTRRVSDSTDSQIVKILPDDNLKEYDDNGSVDVKLDDPVITWRDIVVYQDAIWKPEVKLANSVFEVKPLGNDRTQIKIYNTGMVMWIIPDMYQATCSVDVISFPWDRQSCSLNFLVSTYSSTEVTIQTASDTIHTQEFEDSESWRVMKTKSMTLTSQVQFWVCMERRPSFHISVVFMPIVFLSVLNIFVFLLAADSGERISFSITLLLSITLYLSMISDNLPSHSRGMSAIIYCLNFVLTESTVICVLSIISLNIYNKKGKPPPTLQSILKKLHRSRSRQVQDTDEAHAVSETMPEHTHEEKGDAGSSQHAECTSFTWHDVSDIVDRVCICLASLALCLAFVIFYINIGVGKMECM